jgi:uncharacterized protein (DUF362 family)
MKLSVFKKAFLLLSSALIFGFTWMQNAFDPVDMKSWPAETNGRFVTPVSKVAVIRSDRARAEDITYDDILDMVTRAVEAAGGLESVVSDGDSVLLKPNLVGSGGARPEVNGVTTDVRVVRAVSELVRRLNPTGWIGVMEGSAPAGQYTEDMYALYDYSKESLAAVDTIICLEDACGGMKDYDSPELVAVSLPDERSLYPDAKKPNRSRPIYLTRLHFRADAVISIPTLKNHESAALTCGIKNTSIGWTPISIYSKELWGIPNLRWEIDHEYPNMHKWLHDFYSCRPSDFVVVDGLQGLQEGPGGGSNPAVNRQNMRLVMAGRDLVSVDAIAALTIGLDPAKVDYLTYLHNDKVGCADPTLIRVEGNVLVSDVKKKFAHSDPRTKAAMYSDFSPPAASIHSVEWIADSLKIDLDVSAETVMAELEIDGHRLDQAILNGFDNIRLDMTAFDTADHEIRVTAFDRYLNASTVVSSLAGIEESGLKLASPFRLSPNYPNPFNPQTTLPYRLSRQSQVTITILDVRGRMVKRIDEGMKQAGEYSVLWDGTGMNGEVLPSGSYFYRIEAATIDGRQVGVGKMLLVR